MRRPAAVRMQEVNDGGSLPQPQEPQHHHGHRVPDRRLGQVHGQVLESQQVSQIEMTTSRNSSRPAEETGSPLAAGCSIGGGRQVRREPNQVGAAHQPRSPDQGCPIRKKCPTNNRLASG